MRPNDHVRWRIENGEPDWTKLINFIKEEVESEKFAFGMEL
jgi:hypothetical protein